MPNLISRYTHWLHTRWPAGTVEKLPRTHDDGSCNIPGVYIVGDLTGIPLLKFSSDTGARAVQTIAADADFQALRSDDSGPEVDIVIIGAGVSGMAAALEASAKGLSYTLIEASQAFATIVNFPKEKPIYTYPTEMTPAGDLQFTAEVKEPLLDELREQTGEVTTTPGTVDRIVRSGKLLQVHLTGEGEPLVARRVIIAIGRSGNYRQLGVPGEALDKVSNRLHDPADYAGKDVLVVGGGDSALEGAIALAEAGARVTVSYRKAEFSRPKPDNVDRINELAAADELVLELPSTVKEISEREVTLVGGDKHTQSLPNDAVFAMIGREAPLDFFRRSGIKITGEWQAKTWLGLALFFTFSVLLYHWKAFAPVKGYFAAHGLFPHNVPDVVYGLISYQPSHLIGTIALSMKDPSFWYSLAYTLVILIYGYRRIKRRKTPYVTRQTLILAAVQTVPLFLLPFIVLPWMGNNGAFGTRHQVYVTMGDPQFEFPAVGSMERITITDSMSAAEQQEARAQNAAMFQQVADLEEARQQAFKAGLGGHLQKNLGWEMPVRTKDGVVDLSLPVEDRWKRQVTFAKNVAHITDYTQPTSWLADQLLPPVDYDPNGREYWRASGLILAWPLFVWNVFTGNPLWVWLGISLVQTFIIIPFIIWRWGKGAYCGWICSCGALAETLGDTHRHKMPHGPVWNRLNMIGQVFLAAAVILLVLRVASWLNPGGAIEKGFWGAFQGWPVLNYAYVVDLWWAGILGVGLYFHFSGRVWCRFACPLAALMHIYARFSRFRIIPEKKKCISCNVCTSVCHMGIDVMNFANKGQPMADPECVRCSACVQSCPTGVLTFGQIDPKTGETIATDSLPASTIQIREQK